jgi:hypothetical protein
MMHANASSSATDVEILGSGPHGLSITADLNPLKGTYRIFGWPMQGGTSNMPKGLLLKSDCFASCLYDPDGAFTLGHYGAETNQPYADVEILMPVETFIAHSVEFQKRLVPNLGQVELISVKLRCMEPSTPRAGSPNTWPSAAHESPIQTPELTYGMPASRSLHLIKAGPRNSSYQR